MVGCTMSEPCHCLTNIEEAERKITLVRKQCLYYSRGIYDLLFIPKLKRIIFPFTP